MVSAALLFNLCGTADVVSLYSVSENDHKHIQTQTVPFCLGDLRSFLWVIIITTAPWLTMLGFCMVANEFIFGLGVYVGFIGDNETSCDLAV